MMLRGMGFDNNTSVYVAAGKIYKAEKYMAPLKQMFPRLEAKDTLATPEELAPFKVSYKPWCMPFLQLGTRQSSSRKEDKARNKSVFLILKFLM